MGMKEGKGVKKASPSIKGALEPRVIPKKVKTRIKNAALIDLRRKQIVEGALKVFTVKGFHSSTVREIAEAAGLTMGSLYNYIRSKEDIVYIVYEHVTRFLREDIQRAIAGAGDPEQRLKAALAQNLKTVYQYQDEIMFLYKESASLDRESLYTVLAEETEYIELFEGLLRDYFKFVGQRVDETRLRVAADLISYIPVIMTFRRWSLRRRFDSVDVVMNHILDFVLHGIEFIPLGRGESKWRSPKRRS
jgi:AcrR family transcriptional regulator